MLRDKIVKFFVSAEEYGELVRVAGDVPLSAFCRARVFDKIAVPKAPESERHVRGTFVNSQPMVEYRTPGFSEATKKALTQDDIITDQAKFVVPAKHENRFCKEHHVMGCYHCSKRALQEGGAY